MDLIGLEFSLHGFGFSGNFGGDAGFSGRLGAEWKSFRLSEFSFEFVKCNFCLLSACTGFVGTFGGPRTEKYVLQFKIVHGFS